MQHFLTYVKHSYEVILEAENKLCINLEHDTEAYMVHLFARYLDNPDINKEPVCIKIMQGVGLPKEQKRVMLQSAADECLLINGFELAKSRWPSNDYYKDMGTLAYDQIAYIERPPDSFYINIAENFSLLSKILSKCKASL
jgi:hypothetical protein